MPPGVGLKKPVKPVVKLATRSPFAQFISRLLGGSLVFVVLVLLILAYGNWRALQNEVAFAYKNSLNSNYKIATSPIETTSLPSRMIIEKVGVNAPILWDIPSDQVESMLDKGVVHLDESADIGQNGNSVFIGHSSDYSWKRDPFAAVFSLLPKLVSGDIIQVDQNGQNYQYQVFETKIVQPSQVEVAASSATPELTLITCYPVGTTRERFIVKATLRAK